MFLFVACVIVAYWVHETMPFFSATGVTSDRGSAKGKAAKRRKLYDSFVDCFIS